MKYLKVVIFVLILIAIGVGVYYIYLLTSSPKVGKTLSSETPRPFLLTPKPATKQIAYIVTDYESSGLVSGGSYVFRGNFQAGDNEDRLIKNVRYVFVIGILDDKGGLAKIHLTKEEYDNKMKYSLASGNIFVESKVILTLKQGFSDIVLDTSE